MVHPLLGYVHKIFASLLYLRNFVCALCYNRCSIYIPLLTFMDYLHIEHPTITITTQNSSLLPLLSLPLLSQSLVTSSLFSDPEHCLSFTYLGSFFSGFLSIS
jgi:hypothetical protein